MVRLILVLISILPILSFISCKEQPKTVVEEVQFTQEDSITDRYLILQDSLLYIWNLMINDDNQKLKAMHNLLHELRVGRQADEQTLNTLEQRLEQLSRIRYTQRTMVNPDIVEEYDFASNALITEITTLATTAQSFEQNNILQGLVDHITLADQRVNNYRADYDVIAQHFNEFLSEHHKIIKTIDAQFSLEKRPLFEISQE